MRKFIIFVLLLNLIGVQGCSIQTTKSLQDKIEDVQMEISHLRRAKAELANMEEEIAKLSENLNKEEARWQKLVSNHPDEIKKFLEKKSGN